MLSLLYGGYSQSSLFIIVFLASSLAVVIAYWCWYFYTKYAGGDYPVFQEEVIINCMLGAWEGGDYPVFQEEVISNCMLGGLSYLSGGFN